VTGTRSPARPHPDRVRDLVRRQLPLLVVVGVLLVTVRLAAAPLTNYDTYFHLRFGREFLDGSWSLREPGSVTTFGTADWVPTQWLPELVMAQMEDWFGLPGVAWLSGLLFLTLAVTVYAAARRWSDPIVAALVLILALIACTTGLSMRPQVISYILVTVTVAAWLRAGETLRAPWWLVPLTWLWAMCHGMAPVGILTGLVATAGIALDGRATVRTLARLLAVPVASSVVFALSPVGPGLLPAVLRVSSRAEYFPEWGPPDFSSRYGVSLLVLLGAAVVPLVRRGGATWLTVGLLALGAGWAVYSTRTVPLAACLLVPLAAASLQGLLGPPQPLVRRERLVLLGSWVAGLALVAALVPHTSDRPVDQPPWLDPALTALPAGTPMLNGSSLGGYLIWRYPDLDLMLNGYGDIYTDAELARNSRIENVAPGWLEDVRQSGVRYALVAPGSRVAYGLRAQGWTEVVGDARLQLLVPPSGWMDGPA
jgi:hypothetical protein